MQAWRWTPLAAAWIAAATQAAPAPSPTGIAPDGLRWRALGETVSARIEAEEGADGLRRYTLQSTAQRRPGAVASPRRFDEAADQPVVRTGHLLFDGLFALAQWELRHSLSVDRISDGAYLGGAPQACPPGGCFQTGVLWTYVWTRDSAYAVDLSLAQLDPRRALNTLAFKVSDRRDQPGHPEIVQDTGSGGSWPISSDRVAWARAAWELLKVLDGDERRAFRDLAWRAIANTVEHDREALWDEADGLYRGEQSFLDWREQTYPGWTAERVAHIGMSKSLSTNANHWRILDVAARLAAEQGLDAERDRYRAWADALKAALRRELWLSDAGHFASLKTTALDPAPLHRHDLLGEALAVIDGIADEAQAASTLQHYPHTAAGAPVVWPQAPGVRIYHNQAIWPFASAYWLKAAVAARNAAVADHMLQSLMRGSALHLSNMENLQFQSLMARHPDPLHRQGFGPDIDSEAQLWSVAGYLGAVLDGVFGRQLSQQGIRFQPFVTPWMRQALFAGSERLRLEGLQYKGRLIDVAVQLPAAPGPYRVDRVELNGQVLAADAWIEAAQLAEGTNTLRVHLAGDGAAVSQRITLVDDDGDARRFFGPREAAGVQATRRGDGRITLRFDPQGERRAVRNIFRDGRLVARAVRGTQWTDPSPASPQDGARCYSVEQQHTVPPWNRSHHSEPACVPPAEGLVTLALDAADGAVPLRVRTSGRHAVQALYANAMHAVNTGITCAVKRLVLLDAQGQVLATRVIALPHLKDWATVGRSTLAAFELQAGTEYRLQLVDHYNMSFLQSNASYGAAGGRDGPVNEARIQALEVMRLGR